MKKLLSISIALFAFSTACWAGSSQGLVSYLLVHSPGVVLFGAGNLSGTPSCSTQNQWAISLSDPMGKPMLAVLLAAQAQGKQVYVHGYSNTCRDWPDRELPSYINLIN